MGALSFLKKKKAPAKVPIERVKELSSHGFSEPEIIDILRKEGYSPEEIDRALTELIKMKVSEEKKEKTEKKEETKLPRLEDIAPSPQPQVPYETGTQIPEEYYQYSQYSAEDYMNYIDSLVQARVSEISEKITEISARYKDLEKRISMLNQMINDLMKTRHSQQRELLDKIDAFKDSLEEMNIRIGGLEKAFKETLPALIESVRALTELVQRMKKEI